MTAVWVLLGLTVVVAVGVLASEAYRHLRAWWMRQDETGRWDRFQDVFSDD